MCQFHIYGSIWCKRWQGFGVRACKAKHHVMKGHTHTCNVCTMRYVQYQGLRKQLWNCYVPVSGICLELCLTLIIKVQCRWWTALRLINGLVETNTTNSHTIRCPLFLSLHCFVEFFTKYLLLASSNGYNKVSCKFLLIKAKSTVTCAPTSIGNVMFCYYAFWALHISFLKCLNMVHGEG
jgi:hypothetical protein